jgi:hypothetical protein
MLYFGRIEFWVVLVQYVPYFNDSPNRNSGLFIAICFILFSSSNDVWYGNYRCPDALFPTFIYILLIT